MTVLPLTSHTGKAPFDPATARYVYVLVRTDLSPAQQGVQACHAAMAATDAFGGLTDDTRLALLAVDGPHDLQRWIERLDRKGLPFKAFWEPDRHTGWSALATAPIGRKEGRAFAGLKPWNPLSGVALNDANEEAEADGEAPNARAGRLAMVG